MLLAHRTARPALPALPKLPKLPTLAALPKLPTLPSLSAVGALVLERASSPLLALVLALSVALAAGTASRIVRAERDLQPALAVARDLGTALEATRLLLRDETLGTAEARIARADDQARRFHDLAGRTTGAERARAVGYASTFTDYYVAARRAAAGVSMSAEARGSSLEEASVAYGMLREQLAAGIDAQERALAAARPATAPMELAAWLTVALVAGAALIRRVATRRAAERAPSLEHADYRIAVPARAAATIRLHEAVERLARRRLSVSVAAARVAKRNNERQIEVARGWSAPVLTLVPPTQPIEGMDVYEDEPADERASFSGPVLMTM